MKVDKWMDEWMGGWMTWLIHFNQSSGKYLYKYTYICTYKNYGKTPLQKLW